MKKKNTIVQYSMPGYSTFLVEDDLISSPGKFQNLFNMILLDFIFSLNKNFTQGWDVQYCGCHLSDGGKWKSINQITSGSEDKMLLKICAHLFLQKSGMIDNVCRVKSRQMGTMRVLRRGLPKSSTRWIRTMWASLSVYSYW